MKYIEELKLGAPEIKEVVKELKEVRADHPFISGTFFEMDEIFEGIRNIDKYDLGDYDLSRHFLSGCGALRNQCAIRPDGWAVPCDRLPEITAGNILETPLDIIWRESAAFVEFRKRFTTPITSLPTCGDCRYAPLCTAGCPASAYYTYGTLLARDPFCCYRLYTEELEDGIG
jgi:radical SAM protein with 4Fe4S-binding SPASM domain